VEADVRIAIGNVFAHPVAGYGGAKKLCQEWPDLLRTQSSVETIHVNHSLCDHPNVTIGVMDDNSVREDMNDIAQILRLDFIVDTILNPQKEIIGTVAGDIVMAHKEGVESYTQIYGARKVVKIV
jgi:nickel-dependent lactate racemase